MPPVQVRYPTGKKLIFQEVDAWRTFRSLRRTRTCRKISPIVPLSTLSRDLSTSDSRLKHDQRVSLPFYLKKKKRKRRKETNLPANNKILAHLVLPWRAAFINGVKPDAFLASTSISGHLWSSMFKHSVCPDQKRDIERGWYRTPRLLVSFEVIESVSFHIFWLRNVCWRVRHDEPRAFRVSTPSYFRRRWRGRILTASRV